MPFGEHFADPKLNAGYVYTNYKRNEVVAAYSKNPSENLPAINASIRREEIEPVLLDSHVLSRSDFNDLGDSFQRTFEQTANSSLDIAQLDENARVKLSMIVGAEVTDFDALVGSLEMNGKNQDQEMSRFDIENLYNLMCYRFIASQVDPQKKYAPERSWGKLKTALNTYLSKSISTSRDQLYQIIVSDLISPASVLAPVIGKALGAYRSVRDAEVTMKASKSKSIISIEVPPQSIHFTDNFESIETKKGAMAPYWKPKKESGNRNEDRFQQLLDSDDAKSVIWWHKNGDSGSSFFAIPYHDDVTGTERLFYPDWIIKTQTGFLIVDTKAGITAASPETAQKANALRRWVEAQAGFDGGIVVPDGPNGWKINRQESYVFDLELSGWDVLSL